MNEQNSLEKKSFFSPPAAAPNEAENTNNIYEPQEALKPWKTFWSYHSTCPYHSPADMVAGAFANREKSPDQFSDLTFYVSGTLDFFFHPTPLFEQAILWRGKTYERFTPSLYARLRERMMVAKQLSEARPPRLPPPLYQEARERFNALHDAAVKLWGEDALIDAMKHLTA